MTLTDIKEKIVKQLSKLTIDDFYAEPQINSARIIFTELTKLETDKEIQSFLYKKFPETTAATLRFSLEKSISELKDKITEAKSVIETHQIKIDEFEVEKAKIKEQQADIPKQKALTDAELNDIETEIKQLKPLAGKSKYDLEIQKLEKAKEAKQIELEKYPISNSKLKDELAELTKKIKSEGNAISIIQSEIKSIQTSINAKQKELKQLKEKEETHFSNEYSALEFLYKLLLNIEISTREIYKTITTGKELRNNYNNYYDEVIEERTGELELVCQSISSGERHNFILQYIDSKNYIPKGWRKLIYTTLSNTILNIRGVFNKNESTYLKLEELELSHIDIAALLAVKVATKTKHSVKALDNQIFLGLSGGLSAIIKFRDMGNLISKYQKQPFEIFAKCISSERFVFHTLYYQSGYADSEIKIKAPKGYYILADKLVIEIEFAPAPILIDSNNTIQMTPNISGKAKHEDELERKRKRKAEEDAYWDDYYDDDDY